MEERDYRTELKSLTLGQLIERIEYLTKRTLEERDYRTELKSLTSEELIERIEYLTKRTLEEDFHCSRSTSTLTQLIYAKQLLARRKK